jgi:arylformamidase
MKIETDRIWDLSQPISHDGVAYASVPPPTITHNFRIAAEGFNAETVHMNTHMGTHVDVPFHFDDAGKTIEQVPPSAFAGPALFFDLKDALGPSEAISAETLAPWLDRLAPGDIAILATGWGWRRANSTEFLKEYPFLDGSGARALLERDVHAVGIDTLSIGGFGATEKSGPSHVALLSAGKVIIEDLRIPDELLGRRCYFTAFPILLEGCGGAWTRAVAWELAGE